MQILIIGGGNMGLTYAQSFLRSHSTDKDNMMILEKSIDKAMKLAEQDIGTVYGMPNECLPKADLVILAVKPQDSAVLFENIKPFIQQQQVFLSIMAGVRMAAIQETLGITKIIRAMPNLPAQIGMGMTAFTASKDVTRIELVTVQNLLNTSGKTLYVENEDFIDAATAVSGSGPAYVWYFMDAIIKAARKMGFSESESELLVGQTFRGAIELFNKTEFTSQEWIARVSSKGGTTEAAMKEMRDRVVHEDIIAGVNAALDRAIELGNT